MASTCPLCGGPSRLRFRKNGHDIVRCRSCGLEYVDPIPTDAQLAAVYDTEDFFDYTPINRTDVPVGDGPVTSESILSAPQIAAYDELLDAATERLGRTGSLLDVGCGNGPLLLRARDRGWDAHGLETSDWAVSFCRDSLGLDVRRGVLEGNPFSGEQFDVVTMIHSLEHMPRPDASLREAAKLIAPGGLLRVEVPNLGSLGRRVAGREWQAYVPPSHLWYYDLDTLTAQLGKAGFRVVGSEHRIFIPSQWRDTAHDDPDAVAGPPPAAETGLVDTRGVKQRIKRIVRTPLQWLHLMDAVNVWAIADEGA